MMTDMDYMQRAYRLALKAKGATSPNPMVGSVIVKNKRIIAEGWHARAGGDHAEIRALKKARGPVSSAKMYTTLEPCYHTGRTGPCVDKIIQSGISEVIIGMKDPNPQTNGKSIAKLRRAGLKIKVGLMQEELSVLNEAFIKYTKRKMPFVAVKCAQSLDGKIATAKGHSKWITSPPARRFAHAHRDEYDAILVGINTVLKDDPRLNGSKKPKKIKKIVLDSTLQISSKARLFSGVRPSDCIIATTKKASKKKIKALQKKGIIVTVCPQRSGHLNLKWLFKELTKRHITSILMEGGAHVIGSALKAKLVDKIYIYMAPKIFGDQKALSSIVGINAGSIKKAIQLKKMTFPSILTQGRLLQWTTEGIASLFIPA